MSLTTARSEWADDLTISRYSRCSRLSGVPRASAVMPRMPFMGVRISWLMLARKSLLARLAASAASLACIIDSCARFCSPGSEARVHGDILEDGRLARPDGRAGRTTAPLRVRPGDLHGLQIPLFIARLRHGPHRLRLIVLGIADPAQAIAGDFNDDP